MKKVVFISGICFAMLACNRYDFINEIESEEQWLDATWDVKEVRYEGFDSTGQKLYDSTLTPGGTMDLKVASGSTGDLFHRATFEGKDFVSTSGITGYFHNYVAGYGKWPDNWHVFWDADPDKKRVLFWDSGPTGVDKYHLLVNKSKIDDDEMSFVLFYPNPGRHPSDAVRMETYSFKKQ